MANLCCWQQCLHSSVVGLTLLQWKLNNVFLLYY